MSARIAATTCGSPPKPGCRRCSTKPAFTLVDLPRVAADPLRFRDRKRYSERLREAQGKTGHREAIVVAHGTIDGQDAVIAVFNFAFIGRFDGHGDWAKPSSGRQGLPSSAAAPW